MKKSNILIFMDYFTPGYKAGGPIQSITNLISIINSEFNVYVITRNNDWGSPCFYENIEVDTWISMVSYKIKYLRNHELTRRRLSQEIEYLNPDLIFLNSFFSRFTFNCIQIFLLKRPLFSLIIAPRGELMDNAFAIKNIQKSIYLNIFKQSRLVSIAHWLSTSIEESKSIQKRIGCNSKISLLNNIATLSNSIINSKIKNKGELYLVFLSRIDPIKNLDFLLSIFRNYKFCGKIELDIYGAHSNLDYWNKCKSMVAFIPANIVVNFKNSISPNEVLHTITNYHFFILPTKGENFGHAIFESIVAGTPVIISDNTPWINLKESNVGVDLPLVEDLWGVTLQMFLDMETKDYEKFNQHCIDFVQKHRNKQNIKEEYLDFFKNRLN